MPNLLHISFKGNFILKYNQKIVFNYHLKQGCNLSTIPSSIGEHLENLIIYGNKILNCIPYEASRFLLPDLDDTAFYIVPPEKQNEFKDKQ